MRFAKGASWAVTPLLLLACAATPAQQAGTPANVADSTTTEAPAKAKQTETKQIPLTGELVYYILSAEIAGQRGDIDLADDLYNKADTLVNSTTLASRAAQVATYSRNQRRIDRALERWIQVDPKDADIYIVRAPFLMVEKKYDAVVKSVNTALKLAPGNEESYLSTITDDLIKLVPQKPALDIMRRLDVYQQHHDTALFAYARLSAFFKDYDQALPIADKLLKKNPDEERYLVLKADILQRTNKTKQAIDLIADAAQKPNASEPLRFTYGKLLGQTGQTAKARDVFQKIYQDNPDNEDVVFALGLIALDNKQTDQAKKYFTKMLKMGDKNKQGAYFMGLTEQMAGHKDSALVWYASVPTDSPRFDAAQRHYVNLLASEGKMDQARKHLAQMRKQHPDQAVQYYLFEANFLTDHKQNQAAFDLYTQALKEHPGNIDLLYGQAMVAEPLNRLNVLEKDLRAILAKDPNNAQALNALGYTLTDRTNRHKEALALITKALKIRPNDPFYLDSLGWVYFRLGDLDKAEKYLRQAISIRPDAEFMAHLGEVLWHQDKKSEAKAIWQKGLQQDADDSLLLETMHRLDP